MELASPNVATIGIDSTKPAAPSPCNCQGISGVFIAINPKIAIADVTSKTLLFQFIIFFVTSGLAAFIAKLF